jgi:hypothetical protein
MISVDTTSAFEFGCTCIFQDQLEVSELLGNEELTGYYYYW